MRYKHDRTYYNGVKYESCFDLEIEYKDKKYGVSTYLQTEGKRVFLSGIGFGRPNRFQNEYTLKDMRYHDYSMYKNIYNMLNY